MSKRIRSQPILGQILFLKLGWYWNWADSGAILHLFHRSLSVSVRAIIMSCLITTLCYHFSCTDPCGSLVWVQVAHHHNNNNLFNKRTCNTYNINTLFTSSFSCLNKHVLCTLHVLQLRSCTVPESLRYNCGSKTEILILFTSGRFRGCDQSEW